MFATAKEARRTKRKKIKKMNRKIITFDCETSGLIPHRIVPGKRPGTTRKEQLSYETDYKQFPYIVSLAWKVNDQPTKEFIVNQEGREIPKEVSDIHGITTEIANASKYSFAPVIMSFMVDLKDCDIIVGHNIFFDTSIIKANVRRESIRGKLPLLIVNEFNELLHKDKRVDTMRKGIKLCGGKWPKLTELYFKLFNENFEAHNAAEDVEATRRIYLELIKRGIVPSFEEMQEKTKF